MSVFTFEGEDIITIEKESLEKIKEAAQKASLKRSRYCLHHHNDDAVHEMVICLHKDTYVRPHKHINKSESFHMIEGRLMVVFFDDHGAVMRRLTMEPFGGENPFLYRLASETWHSVVPLTEYAVFHETTNGPFIKEESIFPDWAPEDGDRNSIRQFLDKITDQGSLT